MDLTLIDTALILVAQVVLFAAGVYTGRDRPAAAHRTLLLAVRMWAGATAAHRLQPDAQSLHRLRVAESTLEMLSV